MVQMIDFNSGLATIADARVGFENVRKPSKVIEGTHTGDFVWTVRLAKIHKGALHRDWSMSIHTMKAIFATNKDEVNVTTVLRDKSIAYSLWSKFGKKMRS
jgi:hypothetical protein